MHFEVRTLRLGLNWHISLLVCARHKKKNNKTRQKGYLLVVILIDSLSF